MTFGTPIIHGTKPRYTKPRGKKYDCGKYGMLRADEAAELAGVKVDTIYARVAAGITGADLAEPTRVLYRDQSGGVVRYPNVAIALRLARAYPDRAPTTEEVQAVCPMCNDTASRWSRAFRKAMAG